MIGFGFVPLAVSAPAAAPAEEPVIWLVGTDEEDFADRIRNAVAAQPELAGAAAAVLDTLAAKAQAGEDVTLLGSDGDAAADLAEIQEANQQLAVAVSDGKAADVRDFSQSGAAQLGGPTDFELRGFAINSNRSWEVKTELDGGFCSGNCEITDIIRQTWKITAQRNVDIFSFTSTYVKNSGNFKNIYADIYVYCNGTFCGNEQAGEGGAQDGTGSGTEYINHQNQTNKETQDRVRMTATFTPNGTRYYDGVKTSTAQCLGGSKMYCLY